MRLGSFPFGRQAYPRRPSSPGLRRWRIRSLTEQRGLSPPNCSISALPHHLPRRGPSCGKLRGEPAISGLDWTFTPIRGSSERFARQHRCGPPPPFQEASTWPRIDRPVSGLLPMTQGEHTSPLAFAAGSRFRSGYGIATLTSPSAGTPWPVFQNVRQDAGHKALSRPTCL